MKKYKYFIFILIFATFTTACNDAFLEKYPKTSLIEENAFETYDNFKAFAYPLYGMLTNTTIATSIHPSGGQYGHYLGDVWSGYLTRRYSYNPYAFQTIQDASSGNGWNFGYIRRANMMLEHIDDAAELTEAEKNHWRAIGYFFHSFWYMELINRFGDIPWVDKVLDETSPEAFGPRENRKVVADKVLDRLKWAEEHIGNFENRDGKNSIRKDVIQATISRFALREGTWRKYHELGDYQKYFAECERVSKILMAKYPTLYMGTDGQPAAGYGEMWTTRDLADVPGVILYKEFIRGVLEARMCYIEHTSSHTIEMPQHTVDM